MAGIPFIKDVSFEYGRPDWLSPLVRRVIAENPGPFTYTGSGTYIVGREEGPVAIIDPGPDNDAHIDALVKALGGAPVSDILITHTHCDHCGGARKLAARIGAPIRGAGPHPVRNKKLDAPALDEGADYGFAPDGLIAHGDIVSGRGWTIETVATPGHLSNHLCFALHEEKTLFTGDHIMGWATTVVAPPDGDMNDYLSSLELLLARDDETYLPTHGAPIEKPKRFVRAVRTHRLMRDAQILDQLRQGRTKIKDIVPAMYADVDPRLHKAAALNVFAHLIRLVKIGSVVTDGAPSLSGDFRRTK
ncbi:MAG: MBL fold metallo-hydrolase [Parvularculaceae bacterium]|nr:MBL fold metallo-hydrolase [Parvularculaceae bacterium]